MTAALPYTVYFENDPEQATVPAQRVVITDQLDADLDWSTFHFGTIQFGERTLLVPDPVGRLHYETDTTVSYDAYPVHVTADLDPQTGIVTWELQSVDPQTGRLPHDLRAGFLPPNDDQNRGAGSVSYVVRPKSRSATRHATAQSGQHRLRLQRTDHHQRSGVRHRCRTCQCRHVTGSPR